MTRIWWLCGVIAVAMALPLSAQEVEEGAGGESAVADGIDLADPEPADESENTPDVPDAPEAEANAPALPPAEPDVETAPPEPVPAVQEPTVELQATVSPRPALGVRFFRGTQVRLSQVLDGSPADQAGLRRNDLIVSWNGVFPGSTDEFIALVAAAPLDEPAEVALVRGGERHTLHIHPDAWNAVFEEPYVAARPDLDLDDDGDADFPHYHAPHYHAPHYYAAPYYYTTNVSPVVVPASWYVPYPYPYPYYYTATWGYWPSWYYYNAYAPGYYYWPYYAYGPYYGYYPWAYPGVYAHPYHAPVHSDDHDAEGEDSARRGLDDSRTVRTSLR